MALVAKVIVDVPSLQTNKPYDYLVPDKIEDVIEKGTRVVVPFGLGNRTVQGFVIDLEKKSGLEIEKLKSIEQLLDLRPILNDEALLLASKMAEETFSFLITCFQTILPAAFRPQYEKIVSVTDELPEAIDQAIFHGRENVPYQEFVDQDLLKDLKKWQTAGLVEVEVSVTDKRTYKKEAYVQSNLSFEEIENLIPGLSKQATKQKSLLLALQALDGKEQAKKSFMAENGLNAANVKTGQEKKWLTVTQKEVYRDPYKNMSFEQTSPLSLNAEQALAYNEVATAMDEGQDQTFLLNGITGSGKTEVYLQLIQKALAEGKTALMLVPEISLTPQMVNRFKGRFGEDVAVLHSQLSAGERYDEWRRIERQEAHVVVGARSAIFAPVENLGIVIMDEEHEASYKQHENPRYHAREVAKWRGTYHHCPILLGSATPAIESMARAKKGVYTLLRLTKRASGQGLPAVEIIDLREEVGQAMRSHFSESLLEKIKDRKARGEQTVLMLNRRGYSSFVMCRDCGFVLPCQNCDISMTLHMDTKTMKCHYCGHEEAIPHACPKCQSSKIRYYGTGTQKVEEELADKLPDLRVLRMDVDTTRKKGSHEKILQSFGQGQADVLLGTQMIAKGLDFPNVTLVGVLNADTALNLPDFRSSERTFQLLTQVSGRAGRGDKSGEVLVQTYNPDHYAIQLAKNHDYDNFFYYEMKLRHQGDYPPYYYVIRLSVSHEDEMLAAKKIYQLAEEIRPFLSEEAIILGPTPKAIARTHNKYHYQILIKYKFEAGIERNLYHLMEKNQQDIAKGLLIAIDPDPMSFM